MNIHRQTSSNYSTLVTIVIPTYNYARYIAESVESALSQTHGKIRIIVIDDGSTDDTRDIIKRYSTVEYHYKNNAGLSAARNTGLQLTNSDYVLFLDSDDRLLPIAIEKNISIISSQNLDFVVGNYKLINKKGNIIEYDPISPVTESYYEELLRSNFIGVPASVLYRTESLKMIGGFDVSLDSCEDFDVYLKLSRVGRMSYHKEKIVEYRRHSTSMSSNAINMHRRVTQVMERQIPYTAQDPVLVHAYKEGKRNWDEIFGRRIIASTLASLFSLHIKDAFTHLKYLYGYKPSLIFTSIFNLVIKQIKKLGRNKS